MAQVWPRPLQALSPVGGWSWPRNKGLSLGLGCMARGGNGQCAQLVHPNCPGVASPGCPGTMAQTSSSVVGLCTTITLRRLRSLPTLGHMENPHPLLTPPDSFPECPGFGQDRVNFHWTPGSGTAGGWGLTPPGQTEPGIPYHGGEGRRGGNSLAARERAAPVRSERESLFLSCFLLICIVVVPVSLCLLFC